MQLQTTRVTKEVAVLRFATVAKVCYDVAFRLRTNFKLKRLAAEWVCFRCLGFIEIGQRGGKTADELAAAVYHVWDVRYKREYLDMRGE